MSRDSFGEGPDDGTQEFCEPPQEQAALPPIQLGFGFTLNGVGGLGGVNRTMDVDALQAGFRAHKLGSLMFPSNPIANAPQIILDMRTTFPAAQGRYVFGPLLEIGWGTR